MKIKTPALLLSSVLLLSTWQSSFAQEEFTNEQKEELVNNLAEALSQKYVLADEGARFSQLLLEKHQAGAFAETTSKAEFIEQLNENLYAITRDKHVSVRPQKTKQPQGRAMRRVVQPSEGGNAAQSGAQKKMVRVAGPQNNNKVASQIVERSAPGQSMKAMFGLPEGDSILTSKLPGNIGLMTVKDLLGSIEEVDSAMATLSDTDGLIIDVRPCPGGSGEISTQIASYFMPEGGALMRYHTRGEPVFTTRSVEFPPGTKRYLNKPVYLVTSESTGSACEALSYVLKYHDLAIVLGENSAGAGHALTAPMTPVGFGMVAFIPNTRPEHPRHKGGFEKVGVAVDIDASTPVAVDRAHQLILSELISKRTGQKSLTEALMSSINKTNALLLAQANERRKYQPLLGEYGESDALIYERGQLKLRLASGRKLPLKQVDDDLFDIVSIRSAQKVRIDRKANGDIKGISISPGQGQTMWKQKRRS